MTTMQKIVVVCWVSGVAHALLYNVVVSAIEGRIPRWFLLISVPLGVVNMAAIAVIITSRHVGATR